MSSERSDRKSRRRTNRSGRRPQMRQQRVKSKNRLARFLYIVGIQSVRIVKRYNRRLRRFFRPVTNLFKQLHYALLGRSLEKARDELRRIREGIAIARQRMNQARRRGFFSPILEFFKISGRSFIRHRGVLTTLLNTLAPAAAIAVLILAVNYFGSLSYGLRVEWNNKDIAYIKSEEVFGSAASLLNQRVVDESAENKDFTPKYTLAVLNPDDELGSANAVCNKLIEESGDSYVEACGLYVDNQLVGASQSTADLRFVLQEILDDGKGSDEAAQASFTKNVELMDGLYSADSLTDTAEVKEKLTSKVQEEQRATVKKGDTGSRIASRYGMTLSELKELNPDLDLDKLIQGQEIKVAKPRTFLTVKITKEDKYTKNLPYSTVTLKDDKRYTSYSQVTQKGTEGLVEYTDNVTYVDGVEIARKNVSKVTLKEAVDQQVTVGTKKASYNSGGNSGGGDSGGSGGNSGDRAPDSDQKPTGRFIWPSPNVRVISSGYGRRWGRLHAGIDIANGHSRGNRVVASDAGTVKVKNSGRSGYGLHVTITHSNGYSTLYGHLMSVSVSSGQRVSQGQTIGKIGNSGASQGNHLHFEVRRNGSPLNPRNFVRP